MKQSIRTCHRDNEAINFKSLKINKQQTHQENIQELTSNLKKKMTTLSNEQLQIVTARDQKEKNRNPKGLCMIKQDHTQINF